MKWETVKRRVVDEVCTMVIEGRAFQENILLDMVASDFAAVKQLPPKDRWHGEIRKAYADKVRERIDNWDIRCAGRLRDLFDGAFPPSLRKGELRADINERGDWVVELA